MTKSIEWFLENSTNFETLLGKLLLFKKDTDYYKFSGFVTAALLDYEDNGISVFAIKTNADWFTFKWTKDDLRKMFNNCIEVVGNTPEESFTFV